MELTLKLILDELNYETEIQPADNPSFSSAELFAPKGTDLTGNVLLIAPLSEALNFERPQGLYFLCIRDRMVDGYETEETMRGLIVIKKNLGLHELFNKVQRVFTIIGGWIMDMRRSLLEEKGLQELMNLSETIIGNHIDVMDATYKLIAYTKNIETDDEVTNDLITHGYHPDATINRLRQNRRFEQYETSDRDGIIVSTDRYMSDYVTVKKVYKCNNTLSVIVVMVCCARPYTEGHLDLFRILLEHISIYVERSWLSQGGSTPGESLIGELIDRSLRHEGEVRHRAAYAGIPFEGRFDLFHLVLGDSFNTPVGRVILELASALPESRVILYHRDILVLNTYKTDDTEVSRNQRLEYIWNLLVDQLECCGISNMFENLLKLPTAYEQSQAASSIGKRLRARPGQPDTLPYNYCFEDYYLHYILEYCQGKAPERFSRSLTFDMMKTLLTYDKKHNTKNLSLLNTYLQCERSATETCARLHMHRNTVLYHINRIEELLGADLNDPDVRLKLLLGYKAHELGLINAAEEK